MTQNYKIRAYLMQNLMDLDMKKFIDLAPKLWTFGIWGLKASLGQFGPKAFDRGLIKALVKSPGSNFHTNKTSLSQ